MGNVYNDAVRNPAVTLMELVVEVSGLDITVRKGTFKIAGVDYELDSDVTHPVTLDADDPTSVMGYLVLDPSGDVALFIDELVHDGADQMYQFSRRGPYVLLAQLFNMQKIPPATTDLAGLDMVVQRSVKPVVEGDDGESS